MPSQDDSVYGSTTGQTIDLTKPGSQQYPFKPIPETEKPVKRWPPVSQNPDRQVAQLKKYRIIDVETGDRFEFHALPDEISLSKGVNWEPTEIQGRSSPLQGYRSSQPEQCSIRIPIHAAIEATDSRTVQDVKDACDFFRSLAYPDYDKGLIKPPHRVRFIASGQFTLTGVVGSVDVTFLPPRDPATGMSHNAIVTLSMLEVDDYPKGYQEVRPASYSKQGQTRATTYGSTSPKTLNLVTKRSNVHAPGTPPPGSNVHRPPARTGGGKSGGW